MKNLIAGLRARVALIACLALLSGSLGAGVVAGVAPAKSGPTSAHAVAKKGKKKKGKKGKKGKGCNHATHPEPDADNKGGPDDGDGCI